MKPFSPSLASRAGWLSTILAAGLLMSGCGGGSDPIPETPPFGVAPTVTTTRPAAVTPPATGVAVGAPISVSFSQPMAAASLTPSSITLACPVGTPVQASVSYDSATSVATLTPTAALPPSTLCEATVTTAVQDSSGIALASAFVWRFVTEALPDSTRPTVVLTVPADGAVGVPINTRIAVTFSEDMAADTIDGASFTVTNTTLAMRVLGNVSYAEGARTATFTPFGPATLSADTVYTVTLLPSISDLAGNALAGNTATPPDAGPHVWRFTTGAGSDTTAPTITGITPADGSTAICLTSPVSIGFSEPMDADTLDPSTVRVADGGAAVPGTVRYEASSRTARFFPASPDGFAPSRDFVLTVVSGADGVKDLAGNALAADRVSNFRTGTEACAPAIGPG